MDIAAFEIADLAAPAGLAHFIARIVEILGIEKFARAVARHFARLIAENGGGTRADAGQRAALVANQDQIERRIEDALVQRIDIGLYALAKPRRRRFRLVRRLILGHVPLAPRSMIGRVGIVRNRKLPPPLSALAHDAGLVPLPVARLFGLALVRLALALGEAELELGAAARIEIDRERNQRHAVARHRAQQFVYLAFVQKEPPRPLRLVIEARRRRPRRCSPCPPAAPSPRCRSGRCRPRKCPRLDNRDAPAGSARRNARCRGAPLRQLSNPAPVIASLIVFWAPSVVGTIGRRTSGADLPISDAAYFTGAGLDSTNIAS